MVFTLPSYRNRQGVCLCTSFYMCVFVLGVSLCICACECVCESICVCTKACTWLLLYAPKAQRGTIKDALS